VHVHVRTRAARWLFDLTVEGAFSYAEVDTDVGVVQRDALTPDLPATLERARNFYDTVEDLVGREAAALAAAEASVVVADAPPVAFAAAARAGVPAFALTNFTWDWIYEDYEDALGQRTGLPKTLRRLQVTADEAWRLPMHGGFAGFRRVRDLPLVARVSARSPRETRRRLGWPETRTVLLVSFGGIGLTGLPLARVASRAALLVVTTDDPAASRPAERALVTTGADGVVVLDERRLYREGLRYEDLVAAADIVVTKPGYGIIAECVANGTAMLYTERGRFAEYGALVREMPRWLRCQYISPVELREARWHDAIDALLGQGAPPEEAATNGAEVAARWLEERLTSRR
jgi:L-arabinokinase